MRLGIIRISKKKLLRILLLLPIYGLIILLIWRIVPEQFYVDWIVGFRPAVWEMLSWRSPYNIPGVYNPPWAFIILIPLALLPPKIGAVILSLLTFFSLLYISRRLGASLIIAVSFLLIPQLAFKVIMNPNIDFIAAFGFILPPQIGLFFLAIKPQIGIAVAVFWLIEAWRGGGLREVIRVFAPVTVAMTLSVLIYGPYMLKATHLMDSEIIWYSYPLWPYAIPVGLTLLTLAIKKRETDFSITASPFMSPYVASYTYPFALLGLVNYRIFYISAYIGMWLVYIILRNS